jgi:hypothetical protein
MGFWILRALFELLAVRVNGVEGAGRDAQRNQQAGEVEHVLSSVDERRMQVSRPGSSANPIHEIGLKLEDAVQWTGLLGLPGMVQVHGLAWSVVAILGFIVGEKLLMRRVDHSAPR